MDAVAKLNQTGPRGEEIFVVVDFGQQKVSVVTVDKNGNLLVTDVQALHVKGNMPVR